MVICDVYVRTSAGNPGQVAEAAAEQEHILRGRVELQGYLVNNVYVDAGEDGTGATMLRPGLQSLMSDMRQPGYRASALAVLSLDRITRDPIVLGQFRELLSERGVRLILPKGWH